MKGREPLYLKPGMDDAELFREFNGRNPYYRHIAWRLAQHVRRVASRPQERILDILGRTGYATRAFGSRLTATIIEHRPAFVEYLKGEFVARDPMVEVRTDDVRSSPIFPDNLLADVAVCCEQASLLQPGYDEFAFKLGDALDDDGVFGMTLGPSNHQFRTYRIADYRSGVVKGGEVMSELSHPIRQAVHAEVVRIARERHGFDRDNAWPPAAKAFDPVEVRSANEKAGFENLAIIEEIFPVPGHQIHLYDQNGWTFYMRWPPLSDLPQEDKIALLSEAVEAVRARPEYDDWCQVDAYHPVAYYLAW